MISKQLSQAAAQQHIKYYYNINKTIFMIIRRKFSYKPSNTLSLSLSIYIYIYIYMAQQPLKSLGRPLMKVSLSVSILITVIFY